MVYLRVGIELPSLLLCLAGAQQTNVFAESLGKVVRRLEEPADISVSINCANL